MDNLLQINNVFELIKGIVIALLAGIIASIVKYIFLYKQSKYTGQWKSEIYDEKGLIVKRDFYYLKHNKITKTLKGKGCRYIPSSQAHRRWKLNGILNGEHLIIAFNADDGQKSDGCVYTKMKKDYVFEGNYLRIDNNNENVIKKIGIKITKNTKKEKIKYAVLDWDNTIKDGYTLFQFIDYLTGINFIDPLSKKEINIEKQRYENKEITHDILAERSWRIFAKYLREKSGAELESTIKNYLVIDREMIYLFADALFDVLRKYSIMPIIISGAPEMIIREYMPKFSIYEVFASKLKETDEGIYTGEVLSNYGYCKSKVIDNLSKYYKKRPLMAFGDSISDKEMLEKAKFKFVCSSSSANKESLNIKRSVKIDIDEQIEDIVKKIEKKARY
jgi:HAD superfamily phosphoserine phosphatase-like hydrolase